MPDLTLMSKIEKQSIWDWQHELYEWAVDKGFWEDPTVEEGVSFPFLSMKLMHIVSEVVEAETALKDGDLEGLPEELADIGMLLLCFSEAMNVDLESEMRKKFELNKTRKHFRGLDDNPETEEKV